MVTPPQTGQEEEEHERNPAAPSSVSPPHLGQDCSLHCCRAACGSTSSCKEGASLHPACYQLYCNSLIVVCEQTTFGLLSLEDTDVPQPRVRQSSFAQPGLGTPSSMPVTSTSMVSSGQAQTLVACNPRSDRACLAPAAYCTQKRSSTTGTL